MLDWNPSHHARNAWEQTSTIYGKIGLVLFYSLVWFIIVACLVSVVFPSTQGAECLLAKAGPENEALIKAVIRAVSLTWVGFLSYADVAGFKVKNVAMVAIFVTVYKVSLLPVAVASQEAGCGSYMMQTWVSPIWATASLILAVIDDKMADRGTAEESEVFHV